MARAARGGLTAPAVLVPDLAPALVRAAAPDLAARDPVTDPVPAAGLAAADPAVASAAAMVAVASAAAATVAVMAAVASAAAAMVEVTDKKAAKFRGFPRNFVYSRELTQCHSEKRQ